MTEAPMERVPERVPAPAETMTIGPDLRESMDSLARRCVMLTGNAPDADRDLVQLAIEVIQGIHGVLDAAPPLRKCDVHTTMTDLNRAYTAMCNRYRECASCPYSDVTDTDGHSVPCELAFATELYDEERAPRDRPGNEVRKLDPCKYRCPVCGNSDLEVDAYGDVECGDCHHWAAEFEFLVENQDSREGEDE